MTTKKSEAISVSHKSESMPNYPVKIVQWNGGYAIKLNTGAIVKDKDLLESVDAAKARWDNLSAFEVTRRGGEQAAIQRFNKLPIPEEKKEEAKGAEEAAK
ncbi:hypothetical protein MLD52_09020 [Puniceicoccaceae bacterium K14]|nr:hypothetical protein [Puniceicoccaceae bacterium K14]